MKRLTTASIILVVFTALLLLVIPRLVSAEGTEELGPANISIASGSGIVAAGTGMDVRRREPETIDIDVPKNATVEQVLLYWSGSVVDASPDDTIEVNGVEISGTLIGGPVRFDTCRACTNPDRYSYRADITDLGLVSAGANALTVSGMDFNREKNGAGVLVVYDDGSGASNIFVRDGIDLAYINSEEPGKTTVPQTFTFAPTDFERTADLVLFVGSVKPNRPNVIRITVAGETTELINELQSSDGPDWDTLTIPVSIPVGASEVTVQIFSEGDGSGRLPASLVWIGASLSVPELPLVINCVDFAALGAGNPVEGLGTVHPALNITTSGHAVAVVEGEEPLAYKANHTIITNGFLGPQGGFFDSERIHDYVFTFAPNAIVNTFSVRMTDFGDWNPNQATFHQASLIAYDVNGQLVSVDNLQFTSDGTKNPTSGSAGNLQITGDAATAQIDEPGNYVFTVSGPNLARVELKFASNLGVEATDPYFALSLLCFDPPEPPSSDDTTCVDFSGIGAGNPVEGLGTVHPHLNINTSGNAVVVVEGEEPFAFKAPNINGISNGGINNHDGFSDIAYIHDYVFSFSPGTTANYFSIRMHDFGDWNPNEASSHEARLVAYNSTGQIVSSDTLQFTSDGTKNPTSGSAGNLRITGDAVTAQLGQPGNYIFSVDGSDIARVEMQFSSDIGSSSTDPYLALSLLCFEIESNN